MTRPSCHRFRSNEVRLWLSVDAHDLGNLWRGVPSGPGAAEEDREVVAEEFAAAVGEDGGRLMKHARYYWLLLAKSRLTRGLFGSMLRRIEALPVPAG